MGKRWIVAAVALALLALSVACSDGDGVAEVTPSPTGELVSPTPEPTVIPEGPPPTPELTPSQEVRSYLGETIAFDFPDNWHLLANSYELEQETVVLANISRDVALEDLPPGAIRIEFTGKKAEPPVAIPGEVKEIFSISGVGFSLREGEAVSWKLTGGFTIGGINFRYEAEAHMNSPEPQMDVLTPILESWVAGSTSNHPTRTCISPVECP